jgi:soluble lytic murein transglycosylase-like protein
MTPRQSATAAAIVSQVAAGRRTAADQAIRQQQQRDALARAAAVKCGPTRVARAAAAEVRARLKDLLPGRIGWEATVLPDVPNGKGGVAVANLSGDPGRGCTIALHVDALGVLRAGPDGPAITLGEAIARARG